MTQGPAGHDGHTNPVVGRFGRQYVYVFTTGGEFRRPVAPTPHTFVDVASRFGAPAWDGFRSSQFVISVIDLQALHVFRVGEFPLTRILWGFGLFL